jgi:hypothetical protein
MKPQGLARIHRYSEQFFAHILRPGQVHVFMNDAKLVTLLPDAKKPITLSTAGLIGCAATVLYAKDVAQRQHAILMHYHPNHYQEHLAELERQIHLLMNLTESFKSMKFISVFPLNNYWLDHATHTADCKKKREELENIAQKTTSYPNINMDYATYELAPSGKGYFAQVYVTLANNAPSKCKVIHWAGGYNCELE